MVFLKRALYSMMQEPHF